MITAWGKIEAGLIKIIYDNDVKMWLEKNRNYKGSLFVKIAKTTRERTEDQNRALHKYFALKSEQCRDAGVTAQLALSKTVELEMSPEMLKEFWRVVQNAMFRKGKSTKNLDKVGDIELVHEHLERFFAEKFNLPAINFPNDPNKIRNY